LAVDKALANLRLAGPSVFVRRSAALGFVVVASLF
jgi:hypothetical protein